MAYARLIFPTTATVQQKLKDIAKICIGTTTTTANLEFATQASSTVVSTEAAGWSIVDANSAIEANGVATITSYRISAPCANVAKTKYCELSSWVNQGLAGAGALNTRPTANASVGFLYIPVGTAVSANTLVNPTWYFANCFGGSGGGGQTVYTANLAVTEIYVSVTSRKLIVSTPNNGTVMNLEFPETGHTTQWNNLPVVNLILNQPQTGKISYGGYGINFMGANPSGGALYQLASFTNWYSTLDNTRTSRLAEDGSKSFYMPNPPNLSVTSTGAASYPLYPFIDDRNNRGEAVHNYSALTDTYYTYRSSSYSANGDEITVGTSTYVVLSVGTSTANYRSVCIKKA